MKGFADYLNCSALKEKISYVQDKIASDVQLKSLAADLIHMLYDENNQKGFLKRFDENRTLLSDTIGADTVDCFIAAVFDMHFDRLVNIYANRNIPEEILAATMDDFNIWAECFLIQNGWPGINEFNWLVSHMSGELFKLGRLQFMVYSVFGDKFIVYKGRIKNDIVIVPQSGLSIDSDGFITKEAAAFTTHMQETESHIEANHVDATGCILPQSIRISKAEYDLVLTKGDPVLDVHIPASGKMDIEECKRSFDEALSFAKTYFPEYKYKAFTIDCWLLGEEIKEILSPETNIMKFSNMFTRIGGYKSTHPLIYKWVFGYDKDPADYDSHKAQTSLQKGTHKLIKENRWHTERSGIILIS